MSKKMKYGVKFYFNRKSPIRWELSTRLQCSRNWVEFSVWYGRHYTQLTFTRTLAKYAELGEYEYKLKRHPHEFNEYRFGTMSGRIGYSYPFFGKPVPLPIQATPDNIFTAPEGSKIVAEDFKCCENGEHEHYSPLDNIEDLPRDTREFDKIWKDGEDK